LRRRSKKPQTQQFPQYSVNFHIRAPELRVIGPAGEQLGVLSRQEAIHKSQELNLDLIEVAPNAEPPVARIVDFNKFMYQQSKKRRESKKQSRSGDVKEIWLTPFIAPHDLNARAEHGKKLLKESGKLKIAVRFKRRELAKRQFGYQVIDDYVKLLGEVSLEKTPMFLGNRLIATVSKK